MTEKFWPIVYVRGFASRDSDKAETVATPYMGFNLGSTKVRQRWTGRVYRHVFESPLVRLMKDYEYQDIYTDGREYAGKLPRRPIAVYRYYEADWESVAGDEDGIIARPEMKAMATGLGEFILELRDRYCAQFKKVSPENFRLYLVAHSMGGLICRCLLQNPSLKVGVAGNTPDWKQAREARQAVEKVFTYGTPHNGIEIGPWNIGALSKSGQNRVFNRKVMCDYMAIADGRANSLDGRFPVERFFSLVGTNARDYKVLWGASSWATGSSGDGLVKAKNAYVLGGPRAHVYRSHSGEYGIVNSVAGYKNLERFLFGDIRVTGTLKPENIPLPTKLHDLRKNNNDVEVRASYHVDVKVAPRGASNYYLDERSVQQRSAVFRTYDELFKPEKLDREEPRYPALFSVYLDSDKKPNNRFDYVVFVADVEIKATEYEVDGEVWEDEIIPGTNVFAGQLALSAKPLENGRYKLEYRWNNQDAETTQHDPEEGDQGGNLFSIPLHDKRGFDAVMELKVTDWKPEPWHAPEPEDLPRLDGSGGETLNDIRAEFRRQLEATADDILKERWPGYDPLRGVVVKPAGSQETPPVKKAGGLFDETDGSGLFDGDVQPGKGEADGG